MELMAEGASHPHQHHSGGPSASPSERPYFTTIYRKYVCDGLPYRAPVLLRDIQGLSTEEASAVLHLKPQTLKSRLHRGRLFLRDRLTEFSHGLALRRPAA